MMSRYFFTALLAFLVLVAPAKVSAAIVTYYFTGQVSLVQNAGDDIEVGDSFTATLSYDPSLAIRADYGVQSDYTFATGGYSLEVSVGSKSGASQDGRVSILNDFSSVQDWFQTSASPANNFQGEAISGHEWRQTTLTLKNYAGTLYDDTTLPSQIASLNNFDESFATLFLGPLGDNVSRVINAQITSIQAIIEEVSTTTVQANSPTSVLDEAIPGSLLVTAPADGSFNATFTQQAATEVDFSAFNFFIPGLVYQVWDLSFDGEIPDSGYFDLVFTYDDTGMTLFQELLLDIFHEVTPGQFQRLFGTVNTDDNTITARTYSFSNFHLGAAQALAVPEPSVLFLLGLSLMLLALGQVVHRLRAPGVQIRA